MGNIRRDPVGMFLRQVSQEFLKGYDQNELAIAVRHLQEVINAAKMTIQDLQSSENNKMTIAHALIGIMALNRRSKNVDHQLVNNLFSNIVKLITSLKKPGKNMRPEPGAQEELDEALTEVRNLAPKVAPSLQEQLEKSFEEIDRLALDLPQPTPEPMSHEEVKNVQKSYEGDYTDTWGLMEKGKENPNDEILKVIVAKLVEVIDAHAPPQEGRAPLKVAIPESPQSAVAQQQPPAAPPSPSGTFKSPYAIPTTPRLVKGSNQK